MPMPSPSVNPISAHDTSAVPVASHPTDSGDDELMALKQKALASLAPMVGKLEQRPEEKFKTLMMLIQASDNSSLIKEAYTAAEKITDEKARAQALIDIVNEINYFTQSKS